MTSPDVGMGESNKVEDSPDVTKAKALAKNPKDRLQRKLGTDFPDLASKNGADWRRWIEGQRKKQEPILRDKRLHWSRHRHFRAGHQWISTRDGRLWREPQSDVNDLRPVLNIIGPALDFRLGILSEQRPGFRHEPIGGGVSGRESAEAQQAVAEFYFYFLRAWNAFLDAWYQAQTDGVAFIHVFVDKTKGPSQEDIDLISPDDPRYAGLKAQGYEVGEDGILILPFQEEGIEAPPGSASRMMYEGDINHRLLLAHEVLFSPEARTINGPMEPRARWACVRRMRDVAEARLETGDPTIESETTITSQSDVLDMPIDRSMGWQRGLPPFPTRRQRITDGVPEYLLWITPDQFEPGLEKGIWMRLVGNVIVERGDELPGGLIPLARFTDGSADTDIYPRPSMSDWIGDQTAINALLGALLKHARYFAGGRILATKNTILEETYSNVVGSVVEYCLGIDTPILMADLTWKSIQDVQIGDEVMAFDEETNDGKQGRKWRVAKVLNTSSTEKESVRVKTEHGEIVASKDHRMLTGNDSRGWEWTKATYLHVNASKMGWVMSPVGKPNKPYELGYLSGLLDGEGSLQWGFGDDHTSRGARVSLSQNPGKVSEKYEQLLIDLGFVASRYTNEGTHQFELRGACQMLQLLSWTRPIRLLDNFMRVSKERELTFTPTQSLVIEKESIGVQKLYDLTTDTGTFIAGGFSVHNSGMKPDVFPASAASPDAWKLLDWLIKKLEDKTGWSDIARGQMSESGSAQDVSGRAVLASQQLFERTFGPAVRSAAEGATEWAHLVVRYAQWLFDEPRLIPAVGGRGDLAKRISSETLGDRPVVYVDPETLMPLPRALRQQLLEDQLDKGRISQYTYQQRSTYADIRDINMGDTDQWARAQWINTLIEDDWEQLSQMPPQERYAFAGFAVLWQDCYLETPKPKQGATGPAAQLPSVYRCVHKDALMDIILDERKPWDMRQVALDRWGVYDQLERSMNDPTGMTMWPPVVLGVPEDKLQAMVAGMQQQGMQPGAMPGQTMPGGGSLPSPGPSSTTPAMTATSPSPEMSGAGIPAAAGQTPKPLGTVGNIERQAALTQNQQT